MSSGMMRGTSWGGRIGARPGWNVMFPCGSTLRGGAGDASLFVSGVFTLGGGITCRGAALAKIYVSCLSAAVCLSPNVMSGLVGVGLRGAWISSAAECVAVSFEDSIGKVSVAGGEYVVSENISFAILGM